VPRIAGHFVAAYAYSAGFAGADLVISVAVAKAESGFNTDSRYVTSQEDSRGLWQINTYAHPNFNGQKLFDPSYNANAARTVWRNAGNRWTPWTTYTRGTYQQYMSEAQQAVNDFVSLNGGQGPPPGGGGGVPLSGEAPADPHPWGPLDFSLTIRGIGGYFLHAASFFDDLSRFMEDKMRGQGSGLPGEGNVF
jgi:hypothetical protein